MSKAKKTVNFESTLAELENLIERMETGDLGLEDSMKAYERGFALLRDCQAALKRAELRVQALTESSEGLVLEELDEEALDSDDDA